MKMKSSLMPALFWLVVIWIMSSLPSKDIPSVNLLGFDKVAHVSVYAVLGFLVNPWLKHKKFTSVTVIFIYAVLILLAAFDEYHQYFIPGRSVNAFDLIANTSGLLIPLCYYLIKHDRSR